MSTSITHTVNVSDWLDWERPDMALPYEVTSAPYGETVCCSFATEAEALAYVADTEALTGDYLTSWGMQAVNTTTTMTHYVMTETTAETRLECAGCEDAENAPHAADCTARTSCTTCNDPACTLTADTRSCPACGLCCTLVTANTCPLCGDAYDIAAIIARQTDAYARPTINAPTDEHWEDALCAIPA